MKRNEKRKSQSLSKTTQEEERLPESIVRQAIRQYFSEIGKRNGSRLKALYGSDYFRKISKMRRRLLARQAAKQANASLSQASSNQE